MAREGQVVSWSDQGTRAYCGRSFETLTKTPSNQTAAFLNTTVVRASGSETRGRHIHACACATQNSTNHASAQ
jgi:hypothetical protein